ncbi:casein kinase family protein [Aspergillus sclerotiicarbonarius CBS 121057]|uniref:Casein kinase family protein n=1 Tax=Aspergillus sclerotiicarbonarius (strain CBS 121057 / IBT 28362) TaxID=1448318 RepID=A0A319EBB6_ASPSB|nr:casein kinase family protein [Aspergillus sclerotiicarbonarius CBS 121057]
METETRKSSIGPFDVIKWPDIPGIPGTGRFGAQKYRKEAKDKPGRHQMTLEDVFIKTQWSSSLSHEAHLLHAASGGVGIPLLHWFETVEEKDVMIMDTYGPVMEESFNQAGRYFGMQSLLLFADQFLSRLEFIHSRKIIHGSLSPWSFAFGSHPWQNHQICLVDFATETGRGASVLTDLQAVGQILAYFYTGSDSWERFQNERAYEKDIAPVFDMFRDAVSTHKSVDYGALRDIFQGAYQDLAFCLAIGLNLQGPRAIKHGLQPHLGDLSDMRTDVLFNSLSKKLSEAGTKFQNHNLSDQVSVDLLMSFEKILAIYMVLLVRDRPSSMKKELVLGAYHLPNSLWRDLRWFMNVTEKALHPCRLAIIAKAYKFVTALYEMIPAYGIYWAEYLLALARSRKEIEPDCGKSVWTQTTYYWQDRFNRLEAEKNGSKGRTRKC